MTDLSDFGAGIDRSDFTEREKLHADLCDWIRSDAVSVYSRESKSYADGTFSVSSRHRPDLLIEGPSYTYVIKSTQAGNSHKVHNTVYKVFEYWKATVQGTDTYSVDGQATTVDAILIATDYSKAGHLFHDRQNKDPLRTGRSEAAEESASFNQIPKIEYSASETALRLLWRFARGYDPEGDVGIGALLSTGLDNIPDPTQKDTTPEDNSPAVLFYTPNEENVHSWNYLPFYLQNDS